MCRPLRRRCRRCHRLDRSVPPPRPVGAASPRPAGTFNPPVLCPSPRRHPFDPPPPPLALTPLLRAGEGVAREGSYCSRAGTERPIGGNRTCENMRGEASGIRVPKILGKVCAICWTLFFFSLFFPKKILRVRYTSFWSCLTMHLHGKKIKTEQDKLLFM